MPWILPTKKLCPRRNENEIQTLQSIAEIGVLNFNFPTQIIDDCTRFYNLSIIFEDNWLLSMRYHLTWLTDKFDKGEPLEFIFFRDHTGGLGSQGEFMLSQWYPSPFSVNEIVYKSAGHWMMARKALLFGDREAFKKIIEADSNEQIRMLGHRIDNFDEVKWAELRHEIVREGNFHKFNQSKKLRKFLLNTGDAILVEANPFDAIWGAGLSKDSKLIKNPYAWNGLNLLGFALMEIREYLKHADFVLSGQDLVNVPKRPVGTSIL
jgi:ribA/ribD-fused uncharacterized protein